MQTRLYIIGTVILLIGLCSSGWIYLTAEDEAENVLGYEIVDGNAYLVAPENSKRYVHDLKLIGGNAAVFADEFSRWFIGLWHGKALAGTVACISFLISLVFSLRPKPLHLALRLSDLMRESMLGANRYSVFS